MDSSESVVSNTSPLLNLALVDRLSILSNYPCTGSGTYIEVCTVESNAGYPCVTREGCC